MKFQAELPEPGNERGGPGWWMDDDGRWMSPEHWPEDYPPVPGWVVASDGSWRSPDAIRPTPIAVQLDPAHDAERASVDAASEQPKSGRSGANRSDDRTMLVISGSIAAVMLLLTAALALITRAGASDDERAPPSTAGVIFAAETESDVRALRLSMAAEAPALARSNLATLDTTSDSGGELAPFDPADWSSDDDACVDTDELVLARRSSFAVDYLDEAECELATGEWFDRYQRAQLSRAIDTAVVHHVPVEQVYRSGGSTWSPETKLAFLTDIADPANLQVISVDSGHNPRGASPDEWKPAQEQTWCAYAVDWVAVKARWSLSVTDVERAALFEMLDSCDDPGSNGADPMTIPLDALADPEIVQNPA